MTLDRLRGVTVKGNDVYLTIDPAAQRLANEALAGKCGAVAAIEPSTGKVLVLASSPSYNENLVERSFALILFETFGLVALLLAAIGIYGVLSGSVSERGISRLALITNSVTPPGVPRWQWA